MPYRVRLRPRPTRLLLRRKPQTHPKFAITFSPFSTPGQRLSLAVRAIQRCYGPRVLIWRKTQILPRVEANRPL